MSERSSEDAENAIVARAATAIAAAAAVLCCAVAVWRPFGHDEIEHVESAWLVAQGLRPYSDFFEHHHPVLWYAMAPLIRVLGDDAGTLLALRAAMAACLLSTAWITARVAARASGEATAAPIAAALLLSMSGFVRYAHQIRPDVPQVLLAALAMLGLLATGPARRSWAWARAGLAIGAAVAFSLKAILLLGVWGLGLTGAVVARRRRGRDLLAFAGGAAVPLALLAAILAGNGSLSDYWLANWTFNAVVTARRPPAPATEPLLVVNIGFWLLALASALHAFVARRRSQTWLVAASGVALLALFLVTGRHEGRTVLLAIPFLAASGGAALATAARGPRWMALTTSALLAGVCFPSLALMSSWLTPTNRAQLAQIAFVLGKTTPEERVWDGDLEFNVFRRPVGYFWFFPKASLQGQTEGARALRAFLFERFGAAPLRNPGWDWRREDACAAVRAARPRIASDFWLDLRTCGLDGLYFPTEYPHLYERRDDLR